jgi:hypothetical protein
VKFPNLASAIRNSSLSVAEIAAAARMHPKRLGRIQRSGGARPEEQQALSRLLGVPASSLFLMQQDLPLETAAEDSMAMATAGVNEDGSESR